MRKLYYRVKNALAKDSSIIEIKKEEFLNGFEFQTMDKTVYGVKIEKASLILSVGTKRILRPVDGTITSFRKALSDALNNLGVNLREPEPTDFQFGEEEFEDLERVREIFSSSEVNITADDLEFICGFFEFYRDEPVSFSSCQDVIKITEGRA